MPRKQTYEGQSIRVYFDPARCIHARECVLGLPAAFRTDKRAWVQPDEAPADDLAAVIRGCPSGALTYERLDDGGSEAPPAVNRVRLWENGPLEFLSTTTVFGTALDITLSELAIEAFFPANAETAEAIRRLGDVERDQSLPVTAR